MLTLLPTYTMASEPNYSHSNCALYAENSEIGAIDIEANNVCINGNILTKGTASIAGNINFNGSRNEYSNIEMSYFTDDFLVNYFREVKIEKSNCVFEENNLNFNNMAIVSNYGDVIIDASNVSASGLIYAPFGTVSIIANNINLNGIIIIAKEIKLQGNSVNINSSSYYKEIIANANNIVDIPIEDWNYLCDNDNNDAPDILEDINVWYKYLDSDFDEIPDVVEKYYNLNHLSCDTDGDGLSDYYEIFDTLTDPLLIDSDNNGIDDANEDFDGDLIANIYEMQGGTSPYFCDDNTKIDVQETICEDAEIVCNDCNDETYNEDLGYGISLLAVSDEEIYSRVISIEEFRDETEVIVDDVEEYFSDYDISSFRTIKDDEEDFISRWNKMANDTDKHYSLCIVNCHANQYYMYNGITKGDIQDLEKFDCDLVLLLGCNCGHSDAKWSNVAYYLSQKVTGIVVASDGTVYSSTPTKWFFNKTATFKSKADDAFDDICDEISGNDRDNYGWVIYKYNSKKKICTWYTTNLKTITIESLLDYLVACNMFDY